MTSINRQFLAIACAATAMTALVLVSSDEALAKSGGRGGSGGSASTGGPVRTSVEKPKPTLTRALKPMGARTTVSSKVNSVGGVR